MNKLVQEVLERQENILDIMKRFIKRHRRGSDSIQAPDQSSVEWNDWKAWNDWSDFSKWSDYIG